MAAVSVTGWEPLVARGPVQPPLAVQVVALVDAQLNVTASPIKPVGADGVSVTVGDGIGTGTEADIAGGDSLPPHAAVTKASDRAEIR